MKTTVVSILLVFAFVMFLIGSFWNPPRVNFIGLGLAAWVLTEIIGRL